MQATVHCDCKHLLSFECHQVGDTFVDCPFCQSTLCIYQSFDVETAANSYEVHSRVTPGMRLELAIVREKLREQYGFLFVDPLVSRDRQGTASLQTWTTSSSMGPSLHIDLGLHGEGELLWGVSWSLESGEDDFYAVAPTFKEAFKKAQKKHKAYAKSQYAEANEGIRKFSLSGW